MSDHHPPMTAYSSVAFASLPPVPAASTGYAMVWLAFLPVSTSFNSCLMYLAVAMCSAPGRPEGNCIFDFWSPATHVCMGCRKRG